MRYIGEFLDRNNKNCKIRVYNTDTWVDEDTNKELLLSSSPLTITTSNVALQAPIQGLGAQIDVIASDNDNISDAEYKALFLSPPLTWKVDIILDGTTIFKGHIDSRMYRENFKHRPYTLSILATDGLKGLKSYEVKLDVYESLDKIIEKCLDKTGLKLPCYAMNTMVGEDMQLYGLAIQSKILGGTNYTLQELLDDQEKVCFQLAQCSREAFKKPDAFSILEGVLKSFDCKIYQENGEWHIDRTQDKYYKGEDLMEVKLFGNGIDSRKRYLTPEILGDRYNYPFSAGKPTLQINNPYGKQTITGTLTKAKGVTKISKDTVMKSATPYDYLIDPSTIEIDSWYKLLNNNGSITPKSPDLYFNDGYFSVNNTSFTDNHFIMTSRNELVHAETQVLEEVPAVIYKKYISTPNFERGKVSDSINIKFKWRMPDTMLLEDDELECIIPVTIAINNKILYTYYHWDTHGETQGGPIADLQAFRYTFGKDPSLPDDFLNLPRTINPFDYQVICSPKRYIELGTAKKASNTYYGECSINISNNNSTGDIKGIGYEGGFNATLPDSSTLTVIIGCPVFSNLANPDLKGLMFVNVPDMKYRIPNFEIGDININIDEQSNYDNTYLGKLNTDHLESAPKLSVDLWNPVKHGDNLYERGLVSDTSRWTNFNHKSNVYKFYDKYIDSKQFDSDAGLGLWYTLSDFKANNSTNTQSEQSLQDWFTWNEDITGTIPMPTWKIYNRLCTFIMKDWTTLYSNPQHKLSATVLVRELLPSSRLYKVLGTGDVQYMQTSRKYDVRKGLCTIQLHEIQNEDIIVIE